MEKASCIKKKHPNRARSYLRQTDVLWLVAQTLLVMPQGWGWAGFVPPRGSLQRGAPISASLSFQPPVAVLAGGAAPCRILMPSASWAGSSGRVNPQQQGGCTALGTHNPLAAPSPPRASATGQRCLPRAAGAACFCLAGSVHGDDSL